MTNRPTNIQLLRFAWRAAIEPPQVQDERRCWRCGLDTGTKAEFCLHCGARVGEHRHVPWWHAHRRLYDWTLAWAYRPSSSVALFCIAFAESSFFPVPPDVLLMPLVLGHRRKWIAYATICTVGSVLGAMLGYAIGMGLWGALESYAYRYLGWAGFTQENFAKVAVAYRDNEFLAVFTAGFTPIPFKLFTVAGGVCSIRFGVLVAASIVSRGARFFLVAVLMRLFGPRITPFVDRYFNWLALAFAALLVGGFLAVKYLA